MKEISIFYKFKPLLESRPRSFGRGLQGKIVLSKRGGAVFNYYRRVDYFRAYSLDFTAIFLDKSIYLNSYLLLARSVEGFYSYFLAPDHKTLPSFSTTFNYRKVLGSSLPLGWIPNNTIIYNIEGSPGSGGQYCRGAGTYSKIIRHVKSRVRVILPSKEKKWFSKYCMASIGRVSNIFHRLKSLVKAGASRHLGFRPHVRGIAKNSADHPMGGSTNKGKIKKNPFGKIIK